MRQFQRHHLISLRHISALLVAQSLAGATTLAQEAPGEPADEQATELDAIVVEAESLVEKEHPTGTASAISEEDLEVYENDDVQKVLLQVPGVQVRGEDGMGLRPNIGLRGTNPERSTKVTLTEDDILFGPAPYSAPAAYYFPMVTRMSAVEVEKGGAQIRRGPNALGGAINFVSAAVPLDGWLAEGDFAGGQYGYFKAHARGGYGAEQVGALLEYVHLGSSGFKDLDSGGSTGFKKDEAVFKFRVNSKATSQVYHQLDLKLNLGFENSSETYLGLTDQDFRTTPNRRYSASQDDEMQWQRGAFMAKWTILPSNSLEVSTTAYRHQFTRDWYKVDAFEGAALSDVLSNPDSPRNRVFYDVLTGASDTQGAADTLILVDNYRYYVSQGLDTKLSFEATAGKWEHRLDAGVRIHHDQVTRRHSESPHAMTQGDLLPVGAQDQITTNNRGRAHALSTYVVDEMAIEQLTLAPGARVELVFSDFEDYLSPQNSNNRTQAAILPGGGAQYQFSDKWGLLGGVYTGFGPSSPQALTEDAPKPKPERSIVYELGATFDTSFSHIDLTGYLNDYLNLTAQCSQSIGCDANDAGSQFSGGRVYVWGLESALRFELTHGDWLFPLRATYSFTDSSFRSSFTSSNPAWGQVQIGDELPYIPKHQASASIGLGIQERFAIDLGTIIASASREVAGQGEIPEPQRTDAYAIFNASARARLYNQFWVYAKADNFLNNAYLTSRRPFGARPGSPLWVSAGLKFKY